MTLAPDRRQTKASVPRQAQAREDARLPIERYFTRPEVDPYDEIEWALRTAYIGGADGASVFEQSDVEFPESWSLNAVNVVASKYFRGPLTPKDGMVRERSVKQLIDRVVNQITEWGRKDRYFTSEDEAETFRQELKHLLVNQYLCFNSPVWFNIDIEEFIWSKAKEERKAYSLGEAGYDVSLDGDAWISIQYQNANNSVRVSDEFMRSALDDGEWRTRYVQTGDTAQTYNARKLMRDIAQAAWECADPGMQYDTTINDWHTCPNTGPITASNPCSEYMHLDDSACNLASINVLKFLEPVEDQGTGNHEHGEGPSSKFQVPSSFDLEAYQRTIALSIMAQEIIVSNSSYPTEKIRQNADAYRQLGLGYSNLGALLMSLGIPYDSDEGRAWCGALTAIMTGHAYATAAAIAARMGPFPGY